MKRTMALLILTALLASIASCGGTSAGTDTTAPDSADTAPSVQDPLMPTTVKDFGGEEFCIISMDNMPYINAEELNGNAINDALYKRDRETEAKLNVNITYDLYNHKEVFGNVQKAVLAGDHVYDLVINHVNWDLTSYATENLVVDWNTVPHVDFTKPYWHSNVIESLSIDGRAPFAASDVAITEVMFLLYNKQLANELQLDSLYDYVYDGTWTWDKLAEISASVVSDINGDTKFDKNDRYGIVVDCSGSSSMLRSVPSACDLYIYNNGKNGLELTVYNEKTETILNKTIDLFHGGGGLIVKEDDMELPESVALFAQGNYLTYFVRSTSAPSAFNDLPFDYGFLPLPKYDEAQENYSSLSWSANLLIPSTADIDQSGLVSEWLSYYGYTYVRPEFYDSMFSARFAQDEDSPKMLDIIFNNMVFDPGMNFLSKNYYGYFDNMVMGKDTNFASYYANREKSEKKYIDSLNESFVNFGN